MHSLPLLHLRPVIVADQVQKRVDERPAPVLANDFGTNDRVAELAREALGNPVARVDREREHVGRLVDPEMLALEPPDLVRRHEVDPELAFLHSLGGEDVPSDLHYACLVDGVGFVQFTHKDVVRHKLVQRIVEAYKRHAEESGTQRSR